MLNNMPLNVDPRKHELLEARIQGNNQLTPRASVDIFSRGYIYSENTDVHLNNNDEQSQISENLVQPHCSNLSNSACPMDGNTTSGSGPAVQEPPTAIPSEITVSNPMLVHHSTSSVTYSAASNCPTSPTTASKRLKSSNVFTQPPLNQSINFGIRDPPLTFYDNIPPVSPIRPVVYKNDAASIPTTGCNQVIYPTSEANTNDLQTSAVNAISRSNSSSYMPNLITVSPGKSPAKPTTVLNETVVALPLTVSTQSTHMVPMTVMTADRTPGEPSISTRSTVYHQLTSPSLPTTTSTTGPQETFPTTKSTSGKKRRRQPCISTSDTDLLTTPRPKKLACTDRGSKRIDELFRCQPVPSFASSDSTSPIRNQRALSPSPNTDQSFDQVTTPTSANPGVPLPEMIVSTTNSGSLTDCPQYQQQYNQPTTTSCHGLVQYSVGASGCSFQLSPIRGNGATSLSDSSGDLPPSSLPPQSSGNGVNPTSGSNIPSLPVYSNVRVSTAALSGSAHLSRSNHLLTSAPSTASTGATYPSNATTLQNNINNGLTHSHVGVQTTDLPNLGAWHGDPSDEVTPVNSAVRVSPSKVGCNFNCASVDELQRRLADSEQELVIQRETVVKLEENAVRSREVIRELLIEKSILVRKTTRQKVMEDRLRLGQFVTQRQGAHFEEKWIEGSRFKELDQRRKNIELVREEIERKKKQWNKRKPTTGDGKKNAKNTKGDEVSVDEFYEQLEIFDLRKQMLAKEDKEIQSELERLDRERNLHIREIKRIANEDASRFNGHPLINERYLLLNLLGKGGFSEVHKGFDVKANRYVACKVHQLNPAWPKDKKDNYIKHALREINIHKTLNHPRIVKVFDVFDIDHDAFCTVLEYSEGNDLDFFLKQNKCIPEREAKSIICQVVSALKYLNERRPPVIHYDLKPGNILLGSGQVAGEIKITDFGLSKLMTEDEYNPETGMDLTSQGAGTYWYLPPECFETGREPPKISSKVDIWSVGVIFFQCLFGKKPFGHNMSQADILHENTILRARTIQFPSTTKVSDGAKEFIRRCCTYRKELRPDIFLLCNDDYLKPKAQLKHTSDTPTMPAPVGFPPSNNYAIPTSCTPSANCTAAGTPGYYGTGGGGVLQQQQQIPYSYSPSVSHGNPIAVASTATASGGCPSLQPLVLPPSN